MTQPRRVFESASDNTDQGEQAVHMVTARELAEPGPDPIPLNAEIAMEWAVLGGD